MHAGRLVPHRLILAAAAWTVLAAGCAAERYVGSVGRSWTYSNRGYGLTANLALEDLIQRWTPIDPLAMEETALAARPVERETPIDLNGDGFLTMDETTRRFEPPLRLVSKTATATWIDVEVDILGGEARDYKLDDLMAAELKKITGRVPSPEDWEQRKVGPDYQARIAEVAGPPSPARLALIDQKDFLAEEGALRRQLVKVRLFTPAIDERIRADFNHFLRSLSLNQAGAAPSAQERW